MKYCTVQMSSSQALVLTPRLALPLPQLSESVLGLANNSVNLQPPPPPMRQVGEESIVSAGGDGNRDHARPIPQLPSNNLFSPSHTARRDDIKVGRQSSLVCRQRRRRHLSSLPAHPGTSSILIPATCLSSLASSIGYSCYIIITLVKSTWLLPVIPIYENKT